MAKRKCPILIDQLISEIEARPSHIQTPYLAYDAEQGHSAYDFISKNYRNEESLETLEKTGDKPETNQRQTEDKTGDKLETTQKTRDETRDKVESQLETELETNWRQCRDKLETILNTNTGFMELTGVQRIITKFIYNQSNQARDKVTGPITIFSTAEVCKTTVSSAKKTLQRLEQKGIIRRTSFKNGRGGWSCYELSDYIFQQMLNLETRDKLETKWRQTRDKVESQLETQLETRLPSSSSSNLISKETTTKSESPGSFPDAWLNLDIGSLEEIGFTQNHVFQILGLGRLDPVMLQESIDAFAFDLRKNGKGKSIKSSPLDFFMGVLRKGPYLLPSNYESPADEAMRLYRERQLELSKKRAAIESEARQYAFENWVSDLSEDDKNALLPDVMRHLEGDEFKLASLENHFVNEVWPAKKLSIIDEARE